MVTDDAEGCPFCEVASKSGEVGVSAADGCSGGVEVEIADTCFCCKRDDKYVVLTLNQYLYVLAYARTLWGRCLQGGFKSEILIAQVAKILHVK